VTSVAVRPSHSQAYHAHDILDMSYGYDPPDLALLADSVVVTPSHTKRCIMQTPSWTRRALPVVLAIALVACSQGLGPLAPQSAAQGPARDPAYPLPDQRARPP
jgi:hypothetical protein